MVNKMKRYAWTRAVNAMYSRANVEAIQFHLIERPCEYKKNCCCFCNRDWKTLIDEFNNSSGKTNFIINL